MLKRTTCFKGKAAAELFYSTKLERKGAAPEPIKATLFGKGGVQGLDQREHQHRKKLFMPFMESSNLDDLFNLTHAIWQRRIKSWIGNPEISLYEEAQLIHTEAICEWFGIPLRKDEIPEKAKELTIMFDYAGAKDLSYFKARFKRKKTERWISEHIEDIRKHPREYSDSYLKRFSLFRDLRGELLPLNAATTEILSALRPAVAISLYVVFLAHALHQFPDRARLMNTEKDRFSFIQEVRRFYPFFPVIPARARENFVWRNHEFIKGQMVLLDIYGTNHDERIWKHPEHFMPERFNDRPENPYDFIPQGGGDHATGHRCPGELITIGFMNVALHCLTEEIDYHVPIQDLKINFSRLPAIINSHMILNNVRPKSQRKEIRPSMNFFQE
ncbi:cytochrome P450 [Peredibacter starrii]|uniref:Cytochrome P450 n=1 Tax=Peredibacter starrii TaxID=28202 RepID=A0AAX4HV05_9BACT|nr:cytochrome P450 [Peredibacter starrii]WPU67195.1 cytochrome P450 [Peredibacter starrii]